MTRINPKLVFPNFVNSGSDSRSIRVKRLYIVPNASEAITKWRDQTQQETGPSTHRNGNWVTTKSVKLIA